jgi:hypothetical protein
MKIKNKKQYIEALRILGPLVNVGVNTREVSKLAICIWLYEKCHR